MSASPSSKPRVLIIGLDGATLDLVVPWASDGKLPHMARLLKEGTWGPLQSPIPPITPPSWSSFMTGMNPGKHGVFHFIEPQPGSYGMRYINAAHRKARTIWSILSDAGLTVGVMNLPFTYPPEAVNGFMISGMDTPDETSDFVHPRALRAELERTVGKINLDIRYLGFMSTDERRAAVLKELAQIDEQRTRMALYLLEKHPADVMMFAYTSSDTAHHYFWQFMDPQHPFYDPVGAKKFGGAVLEIYQRLDRAVGLLLERVSEETSVILVSDHGGGPVSDKVLYLNRFLANIGLLAYKTKGPLGNWAWLQRPVRYLYGWLRSSLSSKQKSRLARLFPILRRRLEASYTAFSQIDWSRTQAFCNEVLMSPPNIWINLKGDKPQGIVESGQYDSLVGRIIAHLYELKDPRTGRQLIRKVYRRDEIYQGPYVNSAPDLTLCWWERDSFVTKPSFPEDRGKPVVQIRSEGFQDGSEWSGTHTLDGILLLKGKVFRSGGAAKDSRIIDLAPTLLHILGLPVPEEMDGRVLTELLDETFRAGHPIQYQKSTGGDSRPAGDGSYSEEDAEKIEKRLQGLGYID
ncbi:MAG: alkaline phosphatase family protein [Nitrospirae bacterium]|nr:alkaline phosphatase family protein [Nitrospirota bacterium]